MFLVHPPAFDDTWTDRVDVGEYHGVFVPIPAGVIHFAYKPAVIDVALHVLKRHAVDHRLCVFTFGSDRLSVLFHQR